MKKTDKTTLNSLVKAIKNGDLIPSSSSSLGFQKTFKGNKSAGAKKSFSDNQEDTSVSSLRKSKRNRLSKFSYDEMSNQSEILSQDSNLSQDNSASPAIGDKVAFNLFKLTNGFGKSFSLIKSTLLEKPHLISPHSLDEIQQYIRRQKDLHYRRRVRNKNILGKRLTRGQLDIDSSDDDGHYKRICGTCGIDVTPDQDETEAAEKYLKSFPKQSDEIQNWMLKAMGSWINTNRGQHQKFQIQELKALQQKASDLFADYDIISFSKIFESLKPSETVILTLMIAEATPTFLQTPELMNILLLVLDKFDDFRFIPDSLLFSASGCLKSMTQNIVGLRKEVQSGVFLFAWHIKAFKEIQAIQKVQDVKSTALKTAITVKGYNKFEGLADQIAQNYDKFIYQSILEFLEKQAVDTQKYLVNIIPKLDITTDPCEDFKKLYQCLSSNMHWIAPLTELASIDLQVSKLTQVIETLKIVNDADCFKMIKETPPSQWISRSEGLVSGSSSASEYQASEQSIRDYFVTTMENVHSEDKDGNKWASAINDFLDDSRSFAQYSDYSYQHNAYQACLAKIMVDTCDKINIVSIPTGSGKSWIIALICYYMKDPSLVIVSNKSLKSQMQVQYDKLNIIDIEIITRTEYYANPDNYDQKLIFLDEYDETVVESPYDVKSANILNGIWDLRGFTRIFAFTATPSAGVERLTKKIFGVSPGIYKYPSEYEFVTKKDPINTSIVCDSSDEPNTILDLICEEIGALYQQSPVICFLTDAQKEYVQAKLKSDYNIAHTLSLTAGWNFQLLTQGVLILDISNYRGLDTRFAVSAKVLIGCPLNSMAQLLQMTGRGCRTRGICYGKYFLQTKENQIQVQQRLSKYGINLIHDLADFFPNLMIIQSYAKSRTGKSTTIENLMSQLSKALKNGKPILTQEQLESQLTPDAMISYNTVLTTFSNLTKQKV